MRPKSFATTPRRLTTLALALAATMTIAVGASAQDQILGADPPSPERAVRGPAEPTHQAAADLSRFEEPVLTVANPDAERAVEVHLVALNSETNAARDVVLALEAGGSTDLSLASDSGFDYLTLVADGAFRGELTDAGLNKLRQELVADPIDAGLPFAKSTDQVCGGNWTLTCVSPSTCSFQMTSAGEVYLQTPMTHLVYWYYHVPIGSWWTQGYGGCQGTWSRDFWNEGCPKSVRNCYGETYTVSGAVSYVN